MRKLAVLTMACALAACSGSEPADTDPSGAASEAGTADGVDAKTMAGFEAVAPGNYKILRKDGKVDQLTILPGMTWAMVYSDGKPAGGTIFAQDGKNCFVTEGVEGHQCFAGSPPAADGSMEVTGEDGAVATVQPVKSFE